MSQECPSTVSPRQKTNHHGPMVRIDVEGRGTGSLTAKFIKHVMVGGSGQTCFGWHLGWDHHWLSGAGALNAIGVLLKRGSLAVDRTVIPLGSKVMIPTFPAPWNTEVFIADDTGGGIIGKHVDVYCGDGVSAEQETFRITAHSTRLCIVS